MFDCTIIRIDIIDFDLNNKKIPFVSKLLLNRVNDPNGFKRYIKYFPSKKRYIKYLWVNFLFKFR